MTLKTLTRTILNYLDIDGTKAERDVKAAINESILDFLRHRNWLYTQSSVTFTRDGSGSYDIPALITAQSATGPEFFSEIQLLQEGNERKWQKVEYETYLKTTDKQYAWVVLSDQLYVDGDSGDLILIYKTAGFPKELTTGTQENLVTKYYWDQIKHWASVNYLLQLGAVEAAAKEKQVLIEKLNEARRAEAAQAKEGRSFIISAHLR